VERDAPRVELALAVAGDESLGRGIELVQAQHANPLLHQRGTQLLVPAAVLALHRLVDEAGERVALLDGRHAVRTGLGVAVLDALQQARHPDFEEFVEVRGGDGEELDPLQQRVALVLGLLQHPLVEGQPGNLAVAVVGRIFERDAGHGEPLRGTLLVCLAGGGVTTRRTRRCTSGGAWLRGCGNPPSPPPPPLNGINNLRGEYSRVPMI